MNDKISKATASEETIATKIVSFFKATILYTILSLAAGVIGCLSPLLILLPFKMAAPVILIWCRIMMFVGAKVCGINVFLSGNIEKIHQPCVIVCNHQCLWETIYLQLLLYPLSTILKRSLLHIPFFGWGLSLLKPIAIDRTSPMQSLKQVKNKGIERLRQGRNILIFPEGTRRPVGQMGNYTRSAADIAKAANVPIIAIAHNGGKYWRSKVYNKKPGTIQMVIGEPIVVGDQDTKEVMSSIQNWTQHQLDKME